MLPIDAFLKTITWSELNAAIISGSDQGYNVLVGSTATNIVTFPSYLDHPRKLVKINHNGVIIPSTAAGAFQIIEKEYDFYKDTLGLIDFSPASQRAIATQMIKECHALDDINALHPATAIIKCSSRWASFPGNNYGQHQNAIAGLVAYFNSLFIIPSQVA